MPRVFVPQMPMRMVEGKLEPCFDISACEEFGTIVELVSSSAKPWTQSVVNEIRNTLLQYSVHSDDYVLLLGSPAMCSLAVAQMADILDGTVNMLQWDGRRGRYFPIQVELWDA